MKFRDIIALAGLRLRNKNSKRVIVAIAFGIVMLTLVVWLVMTMYLDIRPQIDTSRITNLFYLESNINDDMTVIGDMSREMYLSDKGVQLTAAQMAELGREYDVSWTKMCVNSFGALTGMVNMDIGKEKRDIVREFSIKFIEGKGVNPVPDSIDEYIQSEYGHRAVYGRGFSESNMAELYISEKMANELGYPAEFILGKTLSLNIVYQNVYQDISSGLITLDNDTDSNNLHIGHTDAEYTPDIFNGNVQLFKNYKVVGVISQEYYNLDITSYDDSDIWLKDSVLHTDSVPQIALQDIYESSGSYAPRIVATYADTNYIGLSHRLTEDGYFFAFYLGNSFDTNGNRYNNLCVPVRTGYIQMDSYNEANAYAERFDVFAVENGKTSGYVPFSGEFAALRTTMNTIDTAGVIVGLVTGMSLIALLVNFVNLTAFNIRKRQPFMEMMRRMGTSQREKRLITAMEIIGIILISAAIAFVVSFILVLIGHSILSSVIEKYVYTGLNIGFWTFFASYFSVLAVLCLLLTVMVLMNREQSRFSERK